MAKYFSTKKNARNNFGVLDFSLILADLPGANAFFESDNCQKLLNKIAMLFSDKKKPTYMDLTEFLEEKKKDNRKRMSAIEFAKKLDDDIDIFSEERRREVAEQREKDIQEL
ncbi:MAG: hypothetical protein WCR30_04230 [Clostridia bacterium]